jgi:hypothetical protein
MDTGMTMQSAWFPNCVQKVVLVVSLSLQPCLSSLAHCVSQSLRRYVAVQV